MSSWMKRDGRSDLKVFLFIIYFNVSHVFQMSFLMFVKFIVVKLFLRGPYAMI